MKLGFPEMLFGLSCILEIGAVLVETTWKLNLKIVFQIHVG